MLIIFNSLTKDLLMILMGLSSISKINSFLLNIKFFIKFHLHNFKNIDDLFVFILKLLVTHFLIVGLLLNPL